MWIAIIHSAARRAETREGIAKEEQIESDPESEQGSVTDTVADNTKTDAEVNEKPESEPEPGSPAWNRAYIDSHKNEVIAAAKLSMDASGEEYSFPSLASQDWTIVMFDDSAVAAASDIRFRGIPDLSHQRCLVRFRRNEFLAPSGLSDHGARPVPVGRIRLPFYLRRFDHLPRSVLSLRRSIHDFGRHGR